MINKVILVGNLGADPEVRTLESGVKVARIRMATNERYKDKTGEWKDITEWHTVVAWRNLAESAERNLFKGGRVYIEGKLSHRSYQDKDGNDRYVSEVVANVIRALDRKDSATGFDNVAPVQQNEPVYQSTPVQPQQNQGAQEEVDDDLPF